MITLNKETANLIAAEMEMIPEKYQKPFNSLHEGLGVLREEYLELEQEIFFSEKEYRVIAANQGFKGAELDYVAKQNYLMAVKKEAVQVAAMAARIIQELT